jgi:hypothetical protein
MRLVTDLRVPQSLPVTWHIPVNIEVKLCVRCPCRQVGCLVAG